MKSVKLFVIPLIWTLFTLSVEGKKPKSNLLLGGSGMNKILIVNKGTGDIVWEHPLQKGWECNSVAATKKGNILFSYSKGAKMITRQGRELWNIPAPQGCEMQTASLLPGGRALLAWCGHPSTILEVDMKGNILSKTEFETGIKAPHSQFRQIIKNKKGNYLVPLFATSEIREIAPDGKQLKAVKLVGTPFSSVPLPNGNYLVACGDAHSYVELNLDSGTVIRSVNVNDIQGVQLFFVAQLYPLKDGSLYLCNWQGHDPKAIEGKHPQLVQIDAMGKVIWQLNDRAKYGMISSVCPIK